MSDIRENKKEWLGSVNTRVYPKVSGQSHNEIYTYNNKHSLRSSTRGYGSKTYWTDSQNSDTTAPSSRELYHLQFSLQAASPETFGYTLIHPLCSLDLAISDYHLFRVLKDCIKDQHYENNNTVWKVVHSWL
jgi:hypothetical protein